MSIQPVRFNHNLTITYQSLKRSQKPLYTGWDLSVSGLFSSTIRWPRRHFLKLYTPTTTIIMNTENKEIKLIKYYEHNKCCPNDTCWCRSDKLAWNLYKYSRQSYWTYMLCQKFAENVSQFFAQYCFFNSSFDYVHHTHYLISPNGWATSTDKCPLSLLTTSNLPTGVWHINWYFTISA